MRNSGGILLAVALLALAVGLVGHGNAIVNGLGKAFFGVFTILFLIQLLFGEKNA